MKNDPLIEILKKELERKQARNGAYSLRSFSRDLELDPSNLSKIMSYQKNIGPILRLKIGRKLGFDSNDIDGWLKPTDNTNTHDENYNKHGMDVFKVISEWHHYALLEYFKLKNAASEYKSIATSFGLKTKTVSESIQKLVELGLLIKVGNTFIPADEASSSILDVKTSKPHRDQQVQILEGAIDALKNIPVKARSQSSVTVAVDSGKLDEARELIKNFRRDLSRLLSTSENLDSVYQLSISLYPVTKTKLQKEK